MAAEVKKQIKKCLTVAGSDSGGCAGIQADIKTMSACGVFAMSAVTAITSQNTKGVLAVEELSPSCVASQMDAVFTDMGADAVKSGMLFSKGIIEAVAAKLTEYKAEKYVLDPVMIAASGAKLLKDGAIDAVMEKLLPICLLVTPNVPEAEAMSGMKIETAKDVDFACYKIHKAGARNVLIKGGHLPGGQALDTLYDGQEYFSFTSDKINTKNIHGSGCSYASAITAFLALGFPLTEAVGKGKNYVTRAIAAGASFDIGGDGPGPLDHFYGCGCYG